MTYFNLCPIVESTYNVMSNDHYASERLSLKFRINSVQVKFLNEKNLIWKHELCRKFFIKIHIINNFGNKEKTALII